MRFAVLTLLVGAGLSWAAAVDVPIARIKSVGKEGVGNPEAGAAWKQLVDQGPEALLPTLQALDGASPAASNWLRTAANAIAERARAANQKLPAEPLEKYLADTKHAPAGRRIAFEILSEQDPKVKERLLPGFLNDPSVELRRDAVEAAFGKAEKIANEGDKKAELLKLFGVSRDQDQAEKIAKALEKLGTKPDLHTQFGVVTKWMLAGPFESPEGKGFEAANEPEKKVDLSASYAGKGGNKLAWKAFAVDTAAAGLDLEKAGLVDLNKALGKHKHACAYAYTVVESEKEQAVEIRLGCICGVKVFLNGQPLFAREEYHHGERFDQYTAKGTLKAGKNELLIKVCQNDQKEPWAQNWQFKLRICDATGGAVPFKVVTSDK